MACLNLPAAYKTSLNISSCFVQIRQRRARILAGRKAAGELKKMVKIWENYRFYAQKNDCFIFWGMTLLQLLHISFYR
jgi:hypothetical protein